MNDRIGQRLGSYRLTRLLGRGGFADVYLGEHAYLKTPAAIKVLQARVTSNDDLEGFLQEAQNIAHLIHPHIVRVLDFGVNEDTPFLVMDYAPNGTLRQRHPKGTQLPLTTIVPYVKQVANALQHAHDEKLIHRDVKPENILLGRRNEVLLSDFGIALIAQSSRYQSTQDVVGTVAYMSPEQIQGKPRTASDQYSLAIVVYEWICGDRPFHGSFTELCTQHMFASPPALRDTIPTIPSAVEYVLTIALAKDPKQRFSSVQAFATALEQAYEPEEIIPAVGSSPNAISSDLSPTVSEMASRPETIPPVPVSADSSSILPEALGPSAPASSPPESSVSLVQKPSQSAAARPKPPVPQFSPSKSSLMLSAPPRVRKKHANASSAVLQPGATKSKSSSVPRLSPSKSSLMLGQRVETKQPTSRGFVLINLIIVGGIMIGGIVVVLIIRLMQ